MTAQAEKSASEWVKGVLDGSGDSPAQVVVAVILGCIPYVGQGIDAGNAIVSIMKVAEDPNSKDAWFDLILNMVAFIPVVGDGAKIAFKQLKAKKGIGPILDAIPNQKLRGNVDQWFRTLNWASYTKQIEKQVNDIINGLISAFDSWLAKATMGRGRLNQLIAQLRQMQRMANRKIEEVMHELQFLHKEALATPYPNTTARAPTVTSGTQPRNYKPAPNIPPAPQNKVIGVNTQGNKATTSAKNNTSTKRELKKRTTMELGSGGEHITDYYYVKRMRNRHKINFNGVLYEYWDTGHNGIDHVWHHQNLAHKYRITDSKATNALRHRTLMTPKKVMEMLKIGVDAYLKTTNTELGEKGHDQKVKRSVGTTNNDGVQLSHLWISRKIDSAQITPQHRNFVDAIKAWDAVQFKPTTEHVLVDGKGKSVAIRCPYDRSLVIITGNLFDHHAHCKGLDTPKCTRSVTSHMVNKEFILPNDMLPE